MNLYIYLLAFIVCVTNISEKKRENLEVSQTEKEQAKLLWTNVFRGSEFLIEEWLSATGNLKPMWRCWWWQMCKQWSRVVTLARLGSGSARQLHKELVSETKFPFYRIYEQRSTYRAHIIVIWEVLESRERSWS